MYLYILLLYYFRVTVQVQQCIGSKRYRKSHKAALAHDLIIFKLKKLVIE